MSHALRLIEQEKMSLRSVILDHMAGGKTSSYQKIQAVAQEVAAQLEETRALWEKEVHERLSQGFFENMSASQKQALEKEVEGVVSTRLAHAVQGLFDLILGWYRDMQLIKVNAPRAYLLHRDYVAKIEQALQRGELESLETIQKALADARLAFERSTPLFACFENIFLRFNFICQ